MTNKKTKDNQTRNPRLLSRQDAELWERVARSATPLNDQGALKSSVFGTEVGSNEDEQFVRLLSEENSGDKASGKDKDHKNRPARIEKKKSPELAKFDRKEAKHLAGGRLEIESRLDLHGYRQSEAHDALRRFLENAQDSGYRHVLVITGKGKSPGEHDENFFTDTEKGILKRQVPTWLDEAEFRPLVVSYSTASRRHGGDGALYVRIRRQK